MLGEDFQADIPLQMWVYPARTGTPLPEVFTQYAQVPADAGAADARSRSRPAARRG